MTTFKSYLTALLKCAAPGEDGREREHEDSQVTSNRDVLDVLTLDRKSLLERQLPTPVNLHRAR